MLHSTRRNLLGSSFGIGISLLAAKLRMRAAYAEDAPGAAASSGGAPGLAGPAKRMIVLWMNGGPSHIDTWDPKTGPTGGLHKAIATRVPGLSICEHLPRLAAMADQLAVVRSLVSKEGNHQRAQYLLHTGYAPNPTVAHPAFGAWLSKLGGAPATGLPAFVSLGGPSHDAGFLGVEHGPFVLPRSGGLPQNVAPAQDVSQLRLERRLAALAAADAEFYAQTGDIKVAGRRELTSRAVALMRTPELRAFDIGAEPLTTVAAFGQTDFGRSCLTAVRLLQSGVRFTEVALDGWDTHKDNFGRTKSLMETLDPAMSSLLRELAQRTEPGSSRPLIESTLVLLAGDFGRSPAINADEGRDHHPAASSLVLAGAGIRTGQVYGRTDAQGNKVVENEVSVPNLVATIASAMGVDHRAMYLTPIGRPISIADQGTPIAALRRS